MNINNTMKFEPFFPQLKKCADNCFMQGLPSTTFARTLASDCSYYGLDVPSNDDYYNLNTTPGNEAMRDLLEWLGYKISEFGICKLEKFYTCIWQRNNNEDLVVCRTYEFSSLKEARNAAEKLRKRYDGTYPLINVQYADGTVYADYEI